MTKLGEIKLFAIKKFFLAVIICYAFFEATSYVVNFYNPDWIVYEKIFEDGSHLKDTGRDLGFVAINEIFKIYSGDYELFRKFIAILFCVYIFFLAKGSILKYINGKVSILAIFFFLIAFLSIRLTIQIREGLATCIMIIGLSYMLNLLDNQPEKINPSIPILTNLKIFCVFLLAISIHSGLTIFLIIFLFSAFLQTKLITVKIIYKTYGNVLLIVLISSAVLIALLYKLLIGKIYLLQETEQLETTTLSLAKIGYWLVNGFITLILIRKVKTFTANIQYSQIKIFMILLSKYLLIFIFTIVFTSILIKSPSGLVSALGRIYNSALGILLLILCFKTTKNNLFIFLLSIFIIVDQVRIVFEALNTLELI